MLGPRTAPLLLFILIAHPLALWANINCGSSKLKNYMAIVEKVALLGAENRMTFADYARLKNLDEKDVRELFSATGILKCDKGGGTVQVTQSQSVVTTAGHIFFDNECKPRPFTYCKVYMYGAKGFESIDLDLSSLKTGECDKWAHTNDWAVLKTKTPIPKKFRAYKVDPNVQPLTSKDEITIVAGFAKNFEINGQFPPNVAECKSLGRNINGLIDFDCDTGKGASGSAIFRRNETGKFLSAIVSSENELSAQNSATQIEGDFLKAIMDAAGER